MFQLGLNYWRWMTIELGLKELSCLIGLVGLEGDDVAFGSQILVSYLQRGWVLLG